MPIEIIDLDDGVGNFIVGTGRVTDEELVGVLTGHLTQDQDKFRRYRYSYCDYTAVSGVSVSSSSVRKIARLSKVASDHNPDAVVAVVANQPVTFGLNRMWQLLAVDVAWDMHVGQVHEPAIEWLVTRCRRKFGLEVSSTQLRRLVARHALSTPPPTKRPKSSSRGGR